MLWPVEGWLSSSYGYRKDPMGGKGKSFHEGVDLAAWYESPVRSPAAGTVEFSGRKGGYGKVVKIRHEYGYTTLYGHLASRTVEEGEQVKKGTLVGRVGSSGHSTGSHLHYEVRINGKAVNPWPYLVQHYDSYKTAKAREASTNVRN
ncbi:MAG: M23 family metallopeptidase [bacterium]